MAPDSGDGFPNPLDGFRPDWIIGVERPIQNGHEMPVGQAERGLHEGGSIGGHILHFEQAAVNRLF
jgi:hypothetical protein